MDLARCRSVTPWGMYRMIRPRWHKPSPNEVTKSTELEHDQRPGRPQVCTAVVHDVGCGRDKGRVESRVLVQAGLELSRPGVSTEMFIHPDIHDPIAQGICGGIKLPSYVPQVSKGQHRPQGSDSSNVRTEVDRVAVRLHEGLVHDKR
ncbi:unnamed protein product [Phytophthora fragariaefolia]|uniref:Unnamed protein product n=1 Tax=Phytophthora fragariaefolia TaxID=1490495 RepID=A0A9W6XDI3_9STRA|nr:unnamed protein product [Phytophthora fragariaefolia]